MLQYRFVTLPEHEHPWISAMRRQRRQMIAVFALCVVLMMSVLISALLLLSSKPRFGTLGIYAIGAFATMAAPILIFCILAKKQRRWTEQMLQCGGLLCPKCSVPLDSSGEQLAVTCERCKRNYPVNELRQYWENLVADPIRAGTWWVRNYGTGWRALKTRLLWRDGQPRILPFLMANLLLWIGMGAAVAVLTGQSLLAGAANYAPMFMILSGAMLFSAGRMMREGEERYCVKCKYERGPEANAPERCPECGFDWNRFAGTIRGRAKPQKRLVATGALMMVCGFAFVFSPLTGGWAFKLLPTGSLIWQTVHKSGFTMAEWVELRTRSLSPEQVQKLATGLLDKRLKQPWLSHDEGNWLVAQIAAGWLPNDLERRYYREMLEFELIAPDSAKVGSPIKLQLRFTNRGSTTTHPAAEALIGGYFIDDDPQPMAREKVAVAGVMLDGTMRGATNLANAATVTPRHSGTMHVRARVWVVVVPLGAGSQPIQWRDDGTPVIPANAVWSEPREMEKTIEVTE